MKLFPVLLSVAIMLGGVSFFSHTVEADQERSWIPLGTNQTFIGGTSTYLYKGLVYCEPKDMIYFTWKAGTITGNQFYWLDFFTTTQCFNWSDGGIEYSPIQTAKGAPEGDLNRYVIEFSMTTGSAWVRPCANDVVMISITSSYAMTQQTFNITITKDFNTVEGKILLLQSRLDALDKSVSENLTALKNLTARLNDSLAQNVSALSNASAALDLSLRENLSALGQEISKSMSGMNMSAFTNYSRLLGLLNATNELLADNADTINGSLLDLMGDIVELQARLSSITGYNDSEIRSELANLSAIEPVVEYQNYTYTNLTLVNQTLVNQTVVNQTLLNRTELYPQNHTNTTKIVSQDNLLVPAMAFSIAEPVMIILAIYFYNKRYQPEQQYSLRL